MKQKKRKKGQEPLYLGIYKVQRNRITSSGYDAKCVTLPKLWADANNVKVRDDLEFMMERDGTLSVRKSGGGR